MRTLHTQWLCDQTVALGAAILAGTDLAVADGGDIARLEQATRAVAVISDASVGFLGDSTLSLLAKIPDAFHAPDSEILGGATPLEDAISSARSEIVRRENGAHVLSGVLITHAVYLLKQPHLSLRDWLKWLRRCGGPATREIRVLQQCLDSESARAEVEDLLNRSRSATEQTRHRIEAVDRLHDAVCRFASKPESMLWWLRICLALKNSLYCWPLMVGGSSETRLHGISLPIGLFLSRDERSKVYFKIVIPEGSRERGRRYVPWQDDIWAHMEHSSLHWNREWGHAFQTGLHVAKNLWRTQNGRLKFVDERAAASILTASLAVDMSAACAVVDSVFEGTSGLPYRLSGRSAEAYWVQAVLGLMLPAAEIPLGVATGRIETSDGAYEMRHVRGIDKKLEYANNAGFPRVVLAPIESASADSGVVDNRDAVAVGAASDPSSVVEKTHQFANLDGDLEASAISESVGSTAADSEDGIAENEVKVFLRSIAASRARKSLEINFCHDARSVSDAMQASGWRRATFVRLAETQQMFSTHLRRLFLHEQVSKRLPLSSKDWQDYRRNPWTRSESNLAQTLDRFLISETRCIKFVERKKFDQTFSAGAASEVGRWLAWRDHQIRSGDTDGMHGPGLGILCLRSTDTDNELRLWSTIADSLSASPEWWDRFQWSRRDQAASLLAQLLGNQRADPSISSTAAPDVIILFDEGDLTQRRTNRIFPNDFRGQWLDLLNPSKDNPHVQHQLNEALASEAEGRLGRTRIIVIYGPPDHSAADLPDNLDADDKDNLERLAVFRFDFSIQAAYAMLNYARPITERLSWSDVDEALRKLVAKRVLCRTRGRFYVPSRLLPELRAARYASDPGANVHAAKALTPILEPRDLFIASNRDRTLEPEPVLEATWHLYRARILSSPRDRAIRQHSTTALANLTFLRPFADWDTVKQLQRSTSTAADAVELARELLRKEMSITERAPHSSRVAALLNAIGGWARGVGPTFSDARRTELAGEASTLCANAVGTLESLSAADCRRQKHKLFSEYVYCMSVLGVPDSDPRLAESSRYLQGTVREILSPDFGERLGNGQVGLDDYPLSRDWLRARWDDRILPLRERSTYAYVAARLHIGRWEAGELVREPWDQPWIEYFALTGPADFDPRQLSSPLTTWNRIYGGADSATRFGERVTDFVSFRPAKSGDDVSWWGAKIGTAIDNLWDFINHPEAEKRLNAITADVALKFVRVVSMRETIPAFDFLERRGAGWLARWPQRLGRSWSQEWNDLAERIVNCHAGWVCMLSSLDTVSEESVVLAQSWLHARRASHSQKLDHDDPDHLLTLGNGRMKLADSYRLKRKVAVRNGRRLLSIRNTTGWAIYGVLRGELEKILRDIE